MEMVGQAPRLVISEMVLENFKSYAGAQRVGPFHKVLCPAVQSGLLFGARATTCSLCFLTSSMLSSLLSLPVCSRSPRWSAPMAAASPMSLMPCCLCLASGPSR